MPGFDDRLNQLGRELDERLAARNADAATAAQEWEATLSAFREAIPRVVPTLQRAQAGSTTALQVTMIRPLDRRSVGLEVTMAAGPSESASGSLLYKPDPQERQILRTVRVDRSPRRDRETPISPEDLTPEEVEASVAALLRDVKWSLENEP